MEKIEEVKDMEEHELLYQLYKYFTKPLFLEKQAYEFSRHINISADSWGFTSWNEVSINPRNVIAENEKLLQENYDDLINGLNTTQRPKKFEALDNVILTQGLSESIDRDIGAVSTELDYASIGTSATAESEAQTDLIAEFADAAYARKQFSVSGSRGRTNQTMKMGMLFDEDDFDAVPVTIREAGIHWHLSDASKCHARVVSTDFVLDSGDFFVIQINELHENGTL